MEQNYNQPQYNNVNPQANILNDNQEQEQFANEKDNYIDPIEIEPINLTGTNQPQTDSQLQKEIDEIQLVDDSNMGAWYHTKKLLKGAFSDIKDSLPKTAASFKGLMDALRNKPQQ